MIDETSRKLIERAAAHLRHRQGGVAPQPMAAPAPAMAPPAYAQAPYQAPAYQPAPPPQPTYAPSGYAQAAYQEPAYPQAHAAPPQAASYDPEPVFTHPRAYQDAAARQIAPQYEANGYPEPAMNGAAPQTFSRTVSIDRSSLARCGIVVPSSQRSRVVDEFRIVKRQIVSKYMDEPDDVAANRNRVIMVTSSRPREGKSFAAINLALAIATEQDLKVLLIDLDTKHHSMQEMMGIPASYGLTDLLGNPEIDFSQVVLRTNLPNLTVMPAGSPNIRSPELLSSRRARTIFAEMTQRYSDRFIIFDAPAVLASSDPAVLAGLVGQVVMVVEADHTQQEEVETAIGLLSACPNISLLLNKIRTSAADQFGSYTDY
ncbi:MAG TPA: AAA family ATPase [Stellaceae bacterium]|nr:AAA family ATPase [Stellaceae bacterium]